MDVSVRARVPESLALVLLATAACGAGDLQFAPVEPLYPAGPAWLGPNVHSLTVNFPGPAKQVCTDDLVCHAVNTVDGATIEAATIDDPSVFEVVSFARNTLALHPLAPGSTVLRVTARDDTDGRVQTVTTQLSAAEPDELRLRSVCGAHPLPAVMTLPAGGTVTPSFEVLSAGRALATLSPPPLDLGPLMPTEAGTFRLPATSTVFHLTSPAFPAFDQRVWAYELADVSGVELKATPSPAIVGGVDPGVEVQLLVGGQLACQELRSTWTKSVTIAAESSSVCAFGDGSNHRAVPADSLAFVYPHGLAPGICRLTALSDASGHEGHLELAFVAK
jgi:hypothetical protein